MTQGAITSVPEEAMLTRALGLVNQPRCTTPVSSILLPAGIAQAALTADTCHKPTAGYRHAFQAERASPWNRERRVPLRCTR